MEVANGGYQKMKRMIEGGVDVVDVVVGDYLGDIAQ